MTLIPATYAARLVTALPRGGRIHRLATSAELRNARALSPDAVVIDPLTCTATIDLEKGLWAMAGITTLIVYTSPTPVAMRRLMALPTLLGARLILFDVDDRPDLLRATIQTVHRSAHRQRALQELESRTGPLPPDIARGLSAMMTDGGRLTVAELARATRLSIRTVERRLAKAAGPSPTCLVRTARALLARELLCGSLLTVEEVAHRVGYSKVHSFRSLVRWAFGSSPSALRHRPGVRAGPGVPAVTDLHVTDDTPRVTLLSESKHRSMWRVSR